MLEQTQFNDITESIFLRKLIDFDRDLLSSLSWTDVVLPELTSPLNLRQNWLIKCLF